MAPRKALKAIGTVVWTAQYDPFGKATVNEDPDGDGNAITFNVRMPGQYEDVETGLYYNGYRYYSPETGRYLTSDPIGLNGGTNSYLYANANPPRFTDPLGLAACDGLWKLSSVGARSIFSRHFQVYMLLELLLLS